MKLVYFFANLVIILLFSIVALIVMNVCMIPYCLWYLFIKEEDVLTRIIVLEKKEEKDDV